MDADRVSHLPLLINIVGKSELGDHNYVSETVPPTCTMTGAVQNVCAVCGDTVILEELPTVDHTWVRTVVREPTYTEEGLARDVCQVCGKELEIPLAVLTRWKTGDVNNDGQLSAADLVELNRVVAKGTKERQKFDAADIDGDGDVNSADTILLRRILAGTMPYPDDWK